MLRLNILSSRRLAAFLLLAHGMAAGCVFSVALPLWLRSILLLLLLLNLTYTLADQTWHALPFSVVALEFRREGGALMHLRNGKLLEAQVLGNSFVSPYLTIVRLKPKRAWFVRSVLVLPDMLVPALFRTLRVWLKWRLGRDVVPDANMDWTGST